MKKKNGFTLIELLAVIVILAIIALIATPIILNIIEKARKSAFQDSAYGIIEAAKLQYVQGILDGSNSAATYTFDGTNNSGLEFSGSAPEGGQVIVDSEGNVGIAIYNNGMCALKGTKESTVRLIEYDASTCIVPDAADDPIIELIGDREMTLKVGAEYTEQGATAKTMGGSTITYETIITKDGGTVTSVDTSTVGVYTITYETVEINGKKVSVTRTVNVVTNFIGEEVTFDPGDGVSRTWNILSYDENTVTMMLNKNLGETVAWYSSSNDTAYGPVTALETLNTRTSTWTNVPVISSYEYVNNANGNTYSYGYQKVTITNGTAVLTAKDGSTTTVLGTSRARLITGQEAAILMNYTEWDQSKDVEDYYAPDWMKANLKQGGTLGYWTLSADAIYYNYAYNVFYTGQFNGYNTSNSSSNGVRPVITVSKSNL